MEGKLTVKEVVDIAGDYFGTCYGLLRTKYYYRERWFVFLTVALLLGLVLCMVAFSVTVSPLWRNVLGDALAVEFVYAGYMLWFAWWLEGEYKRLEGLPAKTTGPELRKAVIDRLCGTRSIPVDMLHREGLEIIGRKNLITAALPVSNWVLSGVIALIIGCGVGALFAFGSRSPLWLYVGNVVSVSGLLFIQYALVLRIAVWRIRENIIPSRYIPLHILLGDMDKLYNEEVIA